MNSYTFMGLDDVEEGEEISSRKKSFIKRVIAYIKIRRQASRLTRNSITRDRDGAHERLVAAFFSDKPLYDAARFRKTHFPLIKCTSAIRQLAYDVDGNFLDEYMQISERSSRLALDHFCEAVMEIYGPEFLKKHTVTDIKKLYQHHEEKHGFPGMLESLDCTDWEWFGCPYSFKGQYVRRDDEKHGFPGMLESLDCTDWEWFGCPYAFKGQYVRRDDGSNPFILLEAVASQDLWIWHAFFGVAGSNNDINVLYQSTLFNDLKTDRALEIPFVANGISYPSEYYLVDGIYPKLALLVKTIPEPANDDHKRILYRKKQESARRKHISRYLPNGSQIQKSCDISHMVPGGSTSAGRLTTKRRTNGTSYEVDRIITIASKPSTRFDQILVS
nr:hypothetical protein [Tanacetum cinerariifolium]